MPDAFRSPANLSGLGILVIESDEDNCELFAAFLRQCGAFVATARTARTALHCLAGQHIDALLTDVSVLNAMSVARFISEVRTRSQHKSVPIIAVTGWSEKDAMCRDGGFSAFMQKPVDLDHLAAVIEKLAGNPTGREHINDPAETMSRLLRAARGNGYCDACLAFALELPLLTVQTASKGLVLASGEYLRHVRHCDSCGRMRDTTVLVCPVAESPQASDEARKCIRCSRPVNKHDEEVMNGDLFHRQCWAILRSEVHIADSRQMTKLTRLRIRASRLRLDSDKGDGEPSDH